MHTGEDDYLSCLCFVKLQCVQPSVPPYLTHTHRGYKRTSMASVPISKHLPLMRMHCCYHVTCSTCLLFLVRHSRLCPYVWCYIQQQYELLKEDRSSVEILENSNTASQFSEIRKSRTKHDLAEHTGECCTLIQQVVRNTVLTVCIGKCLLTCYISSMKWKYMTVSVAGFAATWGSKYL